MTYHRHTDFKFPDNEKAKIWRYIDLNKLISLFESTALFFARGDIFDDPYEGQFADGDIEQQTHRYAHVDLEQHAYSCRREVGINCWHVNEHESDAMWKLYLTNHEGVALQSTVKRLISAFAEDETQDVCIGVVEYIDHDSAEIGMGNEFMPLFRKRKAFEHERELRAMVIRRTVDDRGNARLVRGPIPGKGMLVPVDVQRLIQEIVVAPTAPHSFVDLVSSVTKQCDFDAISVRHSTLYRPQQY